MSIAVIMKRDGRIVPFDVKKIADAIEKSFREVSERDSRALADELAWEVTTRLERDGNPAPTVEHIQDQVEQVLMDRGCLEAAKRYILYRQARTDARNRGERGKGTVVLEPWEPTLTGQALAICAAIRNNGGAERVRGFYESLVPAAETALAEAFEDLLALGLELLTGGPVSLKTLAELRAAVDRTGLSLTADREAWLARQADLLCGALGLDREPVERAQKAAMARAELRWERSLRQTLRCLHARGCTRELTGAPETHSPVIDRLLRCEE